MSIQELADSFGITRQAMWKILKRRGCSFRPHLRFGKENHFYRGTADSDWAQNKVEKALLRGDLQRMPCEVCGESPLAVDGRSLVHAHHCDYNKPLEVIWLCQKHHHEWHKRNKAIPRRTKFEIQQLKEAANLKKVLDICYVQGVEGNSVYLNDRRIAGPKPWGGGKVLWRQKCEIGDVLNALGIDFQFVQERSSQ